MTGAPPNDELTQILNDLSEERGGVDGIATLVPAVYDELRALSAKYLQHQPADHTLQATALVHEAYVRLADAAGGPWESRAHFFRVAAKTMRRILINHARSRSALKRGGGMGRLALEEATVALQDDDRDLLEIDEALVRLGSLDPTKARLVELRFFAGCTLPEIAETFAVSVSTVERDWRLARAWLRAELDDPTHPAR